MLYSNTVGLIHLIASVLALASGTFVIAARKGTAIHRKIGYVYAASMLVLLVTAFMIYRLFGGFGVLHVFAVVSSITLACGMIPAIFRKPAKSWLGLHFNFMYWSVIGLYAAFAAEIFTRIPQTRFLWMVFAATFAVVGLGNLFFFLYKKRWEKIAAVYGENS